MEKEYSVPKRVIEPQPCDKIMNFLEFELYKKHGRKNIFKEDDLKKCKEFIDK